MLHRLSFVCLLAAALAVLSGCTDLSQDDGCTSDSQCRFGRICDDMTGQCTGPVSMPDTANPLEPDVEPTPDVGQPEPDADSPEAEPCWVTADARARIQGQDAEWADNIDMVIPLSTIELDASQSQGDIDRHEWTFLSYPQGSTPRFVPDNNGQFPRLFLQLAGTYEVQLTVAGQNAAGEVCSDTDVVEIVACPCDGDIHVQLTWATPGAPDETDTLGADLDLHYMHPNGRWGEEPWDIFAMNPTADWGVQGDDTDDPRLDIDDTDGAGPENINHNGLENVRYSVGVYYNDDNGLGTSYATVRVYVRGTLMLEVENKHMPRTGTFWHVADIEWPSATVTRVDRLFQGYPRP